MIRPLLLALLLASPASAAKKLPKDAPPCPPPGARQIFIAPMGEPFRADQGAPYPVAAWFAQADADHDGKLTSAELVEDARRFFRRLDTDRDGRLTPEDVTAYERDIAPEIAMFQLRRAPGPDYGGAIGAGRYAFLNIPQPVSSADVDVDRIVSEEEFAGAAARRFALLDPAGSGAVKREALPKTPAQVASELPCRPPGEVKPGRERERRPDRGPPPR